jgi:hypothetical protein
MLFTLLLLSQIVAITFDIISLAGSLLNFMVDCLVPALRTNGQDSRVGFISSGWHTI